MKKAWKITWGITAGVAAVACITGAVLYHQLSPARHFSENKLPVLATPETLTVPQSESAAPAASASPAASEAPKPSESDPMAGVSMDTKGVNILVLGIDRRAEEASRADSILLAHLDPDEGKATVVSIPRDTRVMLPNVGYTKINHAHMLGESKDGNEGGTKAMIQAVSNFMQVPIHYYVKTDFNGFESIIDKLGGIELDLPKDVNLGDKVIPAGKQQVDGKTALRIARERYRMSGGDFDRQTDQAVILRAIADKVLSGSHITNLPSILLKVRKDVVDTNLSDSDVMSLALLFKDMSHDKMIHEKVPGSPAMMMDPLVGSKLWYWIPDMKGVRELRDHIFTDQ